MSLLINDLQNIHESGKLSPEKNEILSILLSAINDWPNTIVSLADYEIDIHKLFGADIEKKKIKDHLSKVDYSKDAWQAESLSQLIEVYKYYKEDKPLKEIFKEIIQEIESD